MQDFGHGFFMSPETYAELSKASSALGRLEPAHESVPDMFAALRAPRLVLIDVRSNLTGDAAAARAGFAAAHVPGARFLSFEAVFTSPRTAESGRHPWPAASHVREALVAFGVLPEDRLVFVDEGAMTFAARALLCARLAGYPDCAVLEGGLTRWRALGLPTETGLVEGLAEKRERAAAFAPAAGPCVIGLDDVVRNLDERTFKLLDARPHTRWLGEEKSDIALDGAAGRIPGSLNRPASENVDAFGRMKSPERLRLEFETLLAKYKAKPADIVQSCGSGVAACLNVLAMDRAGLLSADEARLYAGSWSEWARHPALPRESGPEADT